LVKPSRKVWLVGLLLAPAAALGFAAAPAVALTQPLQSPNYSPPPGAVMDLGGNALAVGTAGPNAPQEYESSLFRITAEDFISAGSGEVPITFVLRNDFGMLEFSDVALYDVSVDPDETKNLLQDGDFSQSPSPTFATSLPKPWTYTVPLVDGAPANSFSMSFVSNACPGYCFVDSTTGGYDELAQNVVLNTHDQYQISFFVNHPTVGPSWTWLQYSTNGHTGTNGDGADILVYVGELGVYTNQQVEAPPPAPTTAPEPSTWAMMLLGFAGLGFLGYRRTAGYRRASAMTSASRP
jgi:hypothetical protein